MGNILSIETSTETCSVAVHNCGGLIALSEITEPGAHAEQLMQLVVDVLERAGMGFNDLNAIAVSEGPGSYTGLRIGVSTAKGLAFGLNLPLISVNTLQALASAVVSESDALIISVLDARRMEIYREVFHAKLNSVSKLDSEVLEPNAFQNYLEKGRVYFVGNALEKLQKVVTHENAEFVSDLSFSAAHLGKLAWDKYKNHDFADLAYFVPNYLKEFKALHSKKNPLLEL
ncbi:tRNA (adenosine(37)-N6)-threonylcarbamoyltransferase complex dimerization subunit type 1 TsaB [Algoriphagus litoralis]|uniref:tRNA (adenosine(37)-N6)-threonylcarbamoyltransferase complex dimerization subunit type 1 TsaB n=1 Tax=Algoriphagus litoralis TaxID=2202829 RepID=UPI000DBA07A6|nr:tRNA (adenosine(37)-N6)-threonylcarbamoyltransferase complex dimerization subunit type 1 TsaB [Algoriphagus litoralis]